ncbi:MAG: hypothetical protein R3F14_12520 [Polyangiaceae bacterium]
MVNWGQQKKLYLEDRQQSAWCVLTFSTRILVRKSDGKLHLEPFPVSGWIRRWDLRMMRRTGSARKKARAPFRCMSMCLNRFEQYLRRWLLVDPSIVYEHTIVDPSSVEPSWGPRIKPLIGGRTWKQYCRLRVMRPGPETRKNPKANLVDHYVARKSSVDADAAKGSYVNLIYHCGGRAGAGVAVDILPTGKNVSFYVCRLKRKPVLPSGLPDTWEGRIKPHVDEHYALALVPLWKLRGHLAVPLMVRLPFVYGYFEYMKESGVTARRFGWICGWMLKPPVPDLPVATAPGSVQVGTKKSLGRKIGMEDFIVNNAPSS